jgi:hypothetical protein
MQSGAPAKHACVERAPRSVYVFVCNTCKCCNRNGSGLKSLQFSRSLRLHGTSVWSVMPVIGTTKEQEYPRPGTHCRCTTHKSGALYE